MPAIDPWTLASSAGTAAILSGLGAWLICRYAAVFGLVDIPNFRSSHVAPRPKGGGLAIVTAALLVTAVWLPEGQLARTTVWLLLPGSAILLAVIGLLDDIYGLGQALRLTAQAMAVLGALLVVGPWAALPVEGWTVLLQRPTLGLIGGLVLLAGLWWVNLYNFMDGIDGLAASQAIFMLVAGTITPFLSAEMGLQSITFSTGSGPDDGLRWLFAAALAGACGGFLVLNWPPARLFMGDCGSLFLGFALFTLALHDVTSGHGNFWIWLILSGCFLTDASVTLFRRLLRGENVRAAHRSHAYQRLARRYGSHRPVALVYCLVNVGWLLPLAVAAHIWPAKGMILALLALLPLIYLAWRAGAGCPDA